MVEFFLWALDPVREAFDDVIGVIRVDLGDVIEPRLGVGWVALFDDRLAVLVETAGPGFFDPSALCDQAIADQFGVAGRP